jgi:hypothetical protein
MVVAKSVAGTWKMENQHSVLRLRLGGKRVSVAAHHATPEQER